MTKTVQVYDLTTKKLSSIPASELAPGMIEAVVAGIGLVWVAAANVQIGGPYRHPPFTENIRQRLRRIKASLDEVFPKTLKRGKMVFGKTFIPSRRLPFGSTSPRPTSDARPRQHSHPSSVVTTSRSSLPARPVQESRCLKLSSLRPSLVRRPSARSSFTIHQTNDRAG